MLAEFFRDKSPARLLLICSLLLHFVSQFFTYADGEAAYLTYATNTDVYTGLVPETGPRGTGWELHPQAYLILMGLAFALLRDDIAEHPLFQRWGYWLTAALFVVAAVPAVPMRTLGGALGAIAILIAIAAAVINWRGRRASAGGPS